MKMFHFLDDSNIQQSQSYGSPEKLTFIQKYFTKCTVALSASAWAHTKIKNKMQIILS